jgi:hypothetical protein
MVERNYYAEAHELAACLAAEGFVDWAARFEEAIAAGSTATEILSALRWHVGRLEGARLPLSTELNSRLKSLLAGLEKVLQ